MSKAFIAAAGGLAALAVGSLVQAQTPGPPALVRDKITVMDTICRGAGGKPAPGSYIAVYDFTGDGRGDFLVSEGNYQCAGKPDLFRKNGQAMVEIYVVDARGQAARAYHETVTGYQIIDRVPRVVKIIRSGAACGSQGGNCAAELQWDARSASFTVAGPGSQAVAAPAAPIDPLAARAGAIAPPTGAAETQATFMARCRREVLAQYPNAKGVDAGCTDTWGRASAALPAVDAILSVAPAQPGPVDVAGLKAKLTTVKWGTKLGKGELAAGKLGKWDVTASGKGPAEELKFAWAAVGDTSPFNVVEGLKVRGASLTEVGCLGFGVEEQTHVYRVAATGKPAFGLTVYERGAPTASASSFYSAILDFKDPIPTLASLKRTPQGADYNAKCE